MSATTGSATEISTPSFFSEDYTDELRAFLEGLARALAAPSPTPQTTFSDDDFSDFFCALGIRGLTPSALLWTADRMMEAHKNPNQDPVQQAAEANRRAQRTAAAVTEEESSFRPGPEGKQS